MKIIKLLTFIVAFGSCGVANASLIGDEISAELLEFGGNLNGPNVHTVGAGAEGNWFGQIEYDLTSDTITVRSLLDSGQNPGTTWIGGLAFSFFDLDWLPTPGEIVGASVISATGDGWSLIDDSDLSFTADSVLISAFEVGQTQVSLDQQVSIQLTTRHTGQAPVPATLALFGLGLVTLGWSKRKKA